MKTFRNYYLSYEKEDRLGFYVRSCGHFNLMPPDREAVRPSVNFCEIFWCLRGSMRFRSGEREFVMKPGHVWYYPAGSRHDYQPCAEGCEYRWVTVAGPDAERLFRGLDISPGLSYAGHCPEEAFSVVELNLTKDMPTRSSKMQALAAAFRILTLLSPGQCLENIRGSLAEHAKNLADSGFSDREFNVGKVASLLGVHRGSLSRAFSGSYGMTISRYIIRCRIRHAMKLLKTTALPIRDIALQSGFNSHEYFCRVFLEQTSLTPAKFRQHGAP